MDEPAPAEEFVTAGGRKAGPGETPVLDVKIPGTDIDIEQHPRADDAKVKTGEGEQKSGTQIFGEGQDAAQAAKQRATDVKEEASGQAQQTKDSVGQRADKARQQG